MILTCYNCGKDYDAGLSMSCPHCGSQSVSSVKINKYDPIEHPAHYTNGKIECIDFIQDKELNFCRGNVIKYIVRAGIKSKDTELEDLKKARQYLDFEIRRLER